MASGVLQGKQFLFTAQFPAELPPLRSLPDAFMFNATKQQVADSFLAGQVVAQQPPVCAANLQARFEPPSSSPALFALHYVSDRLSEERMIAAAKSAFELQDAADELFSLLQVARSRLAQVRDRYDTTVRYVHLELQSTHSPGAAAAALDDSRALLLQVSPPQLDKVAMMLTNAANDAKVDVLELRGKLQEAPPSPQTFHGHFAAVLPTFRQLHMAPHESAPDSPLPASVSIFPRVPRTPLPSPDRTCPASVTSAPLFPGPFSRDLKRRLPVPQAKVAPPSKEAKRSHPPPSAANPSDTRSCGPGF